MSPLTKVLALMVSVLAIFLCGVVVVYVTNTEDFKQKYEQEQSLKMAAQSSVENIQTRSQEAIARYDAVISRQMETIKHIEQLNDDWVRQLQTERRDKIDAQREKQTAMDMNDSLIKTLEDMRLTNEFLQSRLQEAQRSQLRAETKLTAMEEQQNQLLAEMEALQRSNRENLEYIQQLESENELLNRAGGLRSKEVRPGVDRVTNLDVSQTQQPIRGEIIQVKGDLASISIGASSGVVVGQEFNVLRKTSETQIKYMGKLTITYVEPDEAVGSLSGKEGVIVAGDKVSTDFR